MNKCYFQIRLNQLLIKVKDNKSKIKLLNLKSISLDKYLRLIQLESRSQRQVKIVICLDKNRDLIFIMLNQKLNYKYWISK